MKFFLLPQTPLQCFFCQTFTNKASAFARSSFKGATSFVPLEPSTKVHLVRQIWPQTFHSRTLLDNSEEIKLWGLMQLFLKKKKNRRNTQRRPKLQTFQQHGCISCSGKENADRRKDRWTTTGPALFSSCCESSSSPKTQPTPQPIATEPKTKRSLIHTTSPQEL